MGKKRDWWGTRPVLEPLVRRIQRWWFALASWGLSPAAADPNGLRRAALRRADLELRGRR